MKSFATAPAAKGVDLTDRAAVLPQTDPPSTTVGVDKGGENPLLGKTTTPNGSSPEPLPALITMKMIRARYVPLAERTLFRMISAGKFPKADCQQGGKIRLWRRETIEEWIDSVSK